MLIRSRSARMAALAFAVTTPISLAAVPAFAAGDDAVVDATVTSGNVHVTSTKGLSRTTVVLCDGSLVVVPSWAGDPLSGDVPVDGAVRAVFVHSGANTTNEAKALLTLLSPGAVNGDSTGAIAYPRVEDKDPADPCAPVTIPDPGGDDGGDDGGENPNPGGENPNPGGENPNPTPSTSDPAPTTSVAPITVVKAETPAVSPTVVLGETLVAGGELPRTGGGDVQPLMLVALSLVSTGMALRVGSRRIRSASSPG